MRRLGLLGALALTACATAAPRITPLPMALCAGWQGERTCELLHEDEQIRVLHCTFAPGIGHEPHYHPPHFGYVLEGDSTMRVTTADGVADRPVRRAGISPAARRCAMKRSTSAIGRRAI